MDLDEKAFAKVIRFDLIDEFDTGIVSQGEIRQLV